MGTAANIVRVLERIVKQGHDPGVKAVCLTAACVAGADGDGRLVWSPRLEEQLLTWFVDHPEHVDEAFDLLCREVGLVELKGDQA